MGSFLHRFGVRATARRACSHRFGVRARGHDFCDDFVFDRFASLGAVHSARLRLQAKAMESTAGEPGERPLEPLFLVASKISRDAAWVRLDEPATALRIHQIANLEEEPAP